ncbi:hypothetical protein PanWU01x14_017190 [Parasponia andersonii]|uniref:Uncharacterized protein n=1 Tax=Parasponia andersonii TaxID=3476 RepID=A0A2P5DZX6_PARAD|nr:hypothetical protein PanWU01x14_017190 [Parasponia andersonii]
MGAMPSILLAFEQGKPLSRFQTLRLVGTVELDVRCRLESAAAEFFSGHAPKEMMIRVEA